MVTKEIGYISEQTGSVEVRSADGVIRVANVGDVLRDGDSLITGLNAKVVVVFYNGNQLPIGAQSEVLLDESVTFKHGPYDDADVNQIAALQKIIVDGIDLAELDPTSAGLVGQNSSIDALHQSSDYEREGREGEVDTRLTPFGINTNDFEIERENLLFDNNTGIGISQTEVDPPVVTPPASASATITVDNITADDIVNSSEAGGSINVTGTVGGDASVGDAISFTVNGTNYTGTVLAGNTYSVAVAGSDLAADTTFDVSVSGSNTSGTSFSATTTSTHTVDTTSSATITVNNITADDIVNAAEAGSSINVTGSVGGDATVGDAISFTVNGTTYTGTVLAGNTYSVAVAGSDLAADTTFDVSVSGDDTSGNPFTATTTSTHTVDTTSSATITVDNITADDIVNAAEAGSSINVTGSVGGDATVGDAISFTVNGTNYTGTVLAGNTYSVAVAGSDLAVDTTFDVSVNGSDTSGNPFTATTTSTHTVDTTASATITVDNITADDIVNAAEASGNINVTGSVGGDATVGDAISFVVNGTTYNGTVLAGNTYSVAVAGSDLAVDTTFDVSVSGSDTSGNPFTATTTSTHTVDTTSTVSISVDNITADDIVNAAEAGGSINVIGNVAGDASVGDAISFTVNGTNYTGTVLAGNAYSVAVAGSDLAADTTFDVSVTGVDAGGNPFTATTTSTHTVDTTSSATITVDNITADDIVNAAEAGGSINVIGMVGGDASVGDAISFVVNGTTYNGTVLAGNTYSVAVAGSDLAADTTFDVSVSGSDTSGNPFTATTTSTHTVDLAAAATITVNNITTDDIVNAAEAGGSINVTGNVGGDASVGDAISFVVNGTTYNGTVLAGNTYSIAVAGSDLAADTNFDVTVTGNDTSGNPFTATTTSIHTVDTTASATITVNNITVDDIVNAAEAGGSINVIGTVGGDATVGDAISFVVNGTTYNGTVLAGNTYSVAVAGSDLAVDTTFDVTVTGNDTSGNPFTATTTSIHTVDTTASATITVNNITADDVVNAAEAGGSINVIGTVGGDATVGDAISFVVNGTTYNGTVLAGNTYSVAVAGSDLAVDTTFDVTVTGNDTSGNPFTATTTSTHTVDTTSTASISVGNITVDDIVNAVEAGSSINVMGSVAGDATVGDAISFTVNGTNYTGTVLAGNIYSVAVAGSDLAVDTTFDISVTGVDVGGNPFTATTTSTHTVDTTSSATITVDNITTDDIVNAAEAGGSINVIGTVGGDASVGDSISFVVNGTTYNGTVLVGNTYSVAVAGSDLAVDTTFDVTVSGSDVAGNPFTATTTSTHTVDTTSSATITVDNITTDDIVNAAEAGGSINVIGTVGGDATVGDAISFVVNGTTYNGTVLAGNTYSVAVAGSDLAVDTTFDVTVTGNDISGNPFTATTTSTHTADTTSSATITVDNITTDDIVNAAEAGGSINVIGTVGGDATVGDAISFVVNGTTYNGTVLAGNTYSVAVAGSDLAVDTTFDVSVSGSDTSGNPFTATTTSTHTVDTASSATITVGNITTDDIVNAAETGGSINVIGTVGGDATVGDAISFVVNGTTYNGVVLAGNTYSVAVAGSDLAADTTFDVTVTGNDTSGNPFTATTTSTHGVDLVAAATITVGNITADDIVNAAEAGGSINVIGTVGGDASAGDAISFVVNGTTYNGTVLAGNTYSVAVAGSDLAVDTTFDVTVTGNDTAGNPFTATTTSTHTVDTTSTASISVDNITIDDIVNAVEAGSSINVTGGVAGDATAGDAISFTVNGTNYTGVVLPGNTYSVVVAGSDLAADTTFDISVVGVDGGGNPFTATTTSIHTVDTVSSATITVDNITTDDIVNAAEAGGSINVIGTVGGDASVGDAISFVVNGTTYNGTVLVGNTYSVAVAGSDLAVDTTFDVTVSGSDVAGNPFTATTTSTHTVDTTSSATITVDNITTDDIVNAAEAGGSINVIGTVGGDATVGDAISFVVNGTTYNGTVLAGNTYSVAVAGSDLAVDTTFDVSVSGSDTSGNPFAATTTSNHTVDITSSATITVDNITTDDIVNAAEAGGSINVIGTVGGDATVGDAISFVVNGTTYNGTVLAGNTYSVAVAGSDLAADTTFDVSVSGSDTSGNPFTATTTSIHTVDTTSSATITVDNITTDDIVNAAEAGGNINVIGSVGGDATVGDAISFVVNGTTYNGTVLAGNTYSISVAGSDLAADTNFDITVTGNDTAGNPFTATTTSTHTVDTTSSATITVNNITVDDIVNAAEAGGNINVVGNVGGDASVGDAITFTVNGANYTGVVLAGNTYSISVAGSDLAADTTFDITVTGNDTSGNPFTATTTSTHTVDTASAATISVAAITPDDIVNTAEAAGNINVMGTVGGDAAPGDTVSFTINGTNYSGIVQVGNTFSISVSGTDLAADTNFDATVTGSDNAGNPFTATVTSTHTVDTTSSATITVNNITADDIVNAAEASGSINVTGSVGGDATVGDAISFVVNGTTYNGTVLAGNTYSVAVAGSDLAIDTTFDVSVSGSDTSGNPFTATTTSNHSVDTSAAATITVDNITADDILNTTEAAGNVNVTGTVGGDALPGDAITFTINGVNYSGTVGAGNTFSISVVGADLFADTNFDATVTGSDNAGNPFTATTTSTHTVDTTASATITVDNITTDDIVNAAEAGGLINVIGTVGGDASVGDAISFVVNGTTYNGTVSAGNVYSIAVAGSDLAVDTSFDVTVTGSDTSGNAFTATTTSTHGVDLAATATITVNNITADDIVNAAEAGGSINVAGNVGGDANVGDAISFVVNGTTYNGTVLAGNTYSVAVAGSDLANDTTFDITVSGSDTSGNPFTATTTSTHTVDLAAAATITVNNITVDDIVNAAEAAGNINVTGSVGGDASVGDAISFVVNGTTYNGTVLAGNTYSISVAGSDLAADTNFDVTVTGSDTSGNPFSATTTSTHGVDLIANATITVNNITADDIVNAAEAGGSINVEGNVGGDASVGDAISFVVNGTTYNGTVLAGNTYSVAVAGSDLAVDTTFDVTVSGSDTSGNPFAATTTSTHTVDTTSNATITVNNITADDIVNAAEAGGSINVAGTVGGDATVGDAISFVVNGTTYNGTVLPGNTYSISVAGSDLAADTNFDITVSGNDTSGNPFTATTTSTHTVDTASSAIITVANITPDDIVNAAEAVGNIDVTGTVGGDAAPGDTVNFTINGTNYSGVVLAGNVFSISVLGTDLVADTSFDATVTGSDNAGNPFTATVTSTHTVDTTASATISVDAITLDDIVNAAEAAGNINVTGSVGGDASVGDAISFVVNGTTYNGTVLVGNTYSISVAGSDLASDTSFDVTVTGSDTSGNPFSATTTSTHGVDLTAGATITVNNITADDIVNAAEAGGSINIEGNVGGDASVGDAISFVVNGTTYNGTVLAGNTYSVAVAGSDLAVDTTFDITVSGSDTSGNPFAATTTSTHTVDTTSSAIITVNNITVDDIVNAAEAGGSINVAGTVGGDATVGDAISFDVNGTTYNGTVLVGNTYSVAVAGSDLANDTNFDVSVTGSDTSGNPFTATATSTHTVDTTSAANITVNNITVDDIVNAAEAGGSINVAGTVGGDATVGDAISFVVNGTTYNGTVLVGNTYSVAVAGSDLANDTSFDVSVTGSDTSGNSFTATTTSTHTVDTSAAATVVVNNITPDDVLNAAEAAGNVNVTGTVGGDAAPGDTITFSVNGVNYSGTVGAGNIFSITVAGTDLFADTNFDVTVAGNDNAGNPFTATTTSTHTVDVTASATITVDAITPDDIVNAAEAGGSINVTGSVGGDATVGDTISFVVNGTTYNGTVQVGNTYSVAVAGTDLENDTSFDITVTGNDNAGNPFTSTITSTHTVDTITSATITVNSITPDDIISAAEAVGNINVTGTVGGDATPGDTVSFTIDGTNYSGTVQAGNTYSISVAGNDLANDSSFDATVTGTDSANNPFTATTTSTHTINANPPVVDLDGDVAGTGYTTTFVEGASAVSISDSDISITDVDSTNIQSATITLTNFETGDLLNVGGLPPGISASAYNPATGVVTLTGSASLADYQTAIQAIQYENTGGGSNAARVIDVEVSDGLNNSNVASTTVNVTTIPTVTVDDVLVQEPAAGTVSLTFTVSIDEVLGSNLTFDYQTVDISALSGADYQAIAITQGTILAGATSTTITVTVNSDANVFEGDETFSIDLSNFSNTVNFTTSAHTTVGGVQGIGTIGANNGVPDAVDDSYVTGIDTDLVITNLLDNDTLIDGATLTSFSQGTNGSVIDNGDGTFTYSPTGGFAGTDTFTYTLTDADGETDTATVTVTVSSTVNNPPVVTNVPDISYTENDAATSILSGISISDSDSTNLSSVVVSIAGYLPSQDVLAFLTAGTSVTASTSVTGNTWELTLSGGADINEYLSVLNTLTYENSSENPSSSPRSITVEAYDDQFNNLFGTDAGSIAVTPVNDAPDVFDDSIFILDGTNDNPLNITPPTDPDTDDSLLVITVTGLPGSVGTVTLSDGTTVNIGDTLTLAELAGLEFDAGAIPGQGDFTYDVFDGSLTTSATTTINVGSTESDAGTVNESALTGGTGGGTTTVTGNLFANDAASTGSSTLDDINGTTPIAGVITITTALGTLTVYADNTTSGFSAGDYEYVLNNADGTSADVDEVFTYNFTESATPLSDTLTITVTDDGPIANDLMETVPESEEQIFNVVLTLDTSGSMNRSLTDDNAPAAGEPSRLDVAKDALEALTSEFFEQSSQVSVTLLEFSNNPAVVGTYSDFASFQVALNALTAGGGTNYIDTLTQIQTELTTDIAAQNPVDNVQNISYFVSDGEETVGGTPIGNGFDTFVNGNSVDSFAVGIGPGLAGGSADLDFIHNVDSLAQGGANPDGAIIVADINELEAELLNTVPTAFGGNITVDGSVQNIVFGADGGFVQEITTNIAGTDYTFTFDGTNIVVSPVLAGIDIDGSSLTLGPAVSGFTLGTFTFDFADGAYTFSSPDGNAGNQLVFDYIVQDGDGDTASATATIDIVDNAPEAKDDLDSTSSQEVAEGNVINAQGTDGGPSLGNNFTPFASQGGGVDKIVDDADITQVNFRGENLTLDFDSGSVPAGGTSGTLSWTYSTTTNNVGEEFSVVTITDSADNAQLIFNSAGYYQFTPDTTIAPPPVAITETFLDGTADNGITVTTTANGSPAITFNNSANAGIGVNSTGDQYSDSADAGDNIILTFNNTLYSNGVEDISLDFNFDAGNGSVIFYDNLGGVITTVALDGNDVQTFTGISGVQSIELTTAANGDYSIQAMTFTPVNIAPTPPTTQTPEIISYTLTDSDGQTDSAQLSIYAIDNTIAGTVNADSITGGNLNDAIIGDEGNDNLSGGAGHDTISGGLGDDILTGGTGLDNLVGGDGADTLLGGADVDYLDGGTGDDLLDGGTGDDIAKGGAGNDQVFGGAGDDQLEGNQGDDSLYGGAGNDSLLGGEGIDFLYGGQGDDTLTGGGDSDTFVWNSSDEGTAVSPADDTITDFISGVGGDVLDLSNLLQGEESGSLTDYLHFQSDGNGGTDVQIDADGGGTFETVQNIGLDGIDLTAGGTLTDQDIINSLLATGNLIVD